MARIRTIKPEFFTSDDIVSMTPLARLFYVSLWCEADRDGLLSWNVKTLKMRYLPADDVSIDEIAEELINNGLVRLYDVDGRTYAIIPKFTEHQVINNKERTSTIPVPAEGNYIDATFTRESGVNAEGKGKEGKGKEGKGKERKEGKEQVAPAASPPSSRVAEFVVVANDNNIASQSPTAGIWAAYSDAYEVRYHVKPVRNAKVNGQLSQLLKRLGTDEAPLVAQFFVGHNNRYYVQKMHAVDCLLSDAEKIRTEWATGRRVTSTAASEADRIQDTGDMWGRIAAEHEGR
jgi:hypothetical protein